MNQALRVNIFGATGLVGNALVKQLLTDDRYAHITAWLRRPTGHQHPKLSEQLISFDDRNSWIDQVSGDVSFCMMGTTRKTAGSKEAQRVVDYDYQFAAAQASRAGGVRRFVLISSAGANSHSPLFYPQLKGQLEEAIAALGFETYFALRPGPLDGRRPENRPMEKFMLRALKALPSWTLPPSGRPVHVELVASACRAAASQPALGNHVWEADAIFSNGEAEGGRHS